MSSTTVDAAEVKMPHDTGSAWSAPGPPVTVTSIGRSASDTAEQQTSSPATADTRQMVTHNRRPLSVLSSGAGFSCKNVLLEASRDVSSRLNGQDVSGTTSTTYR